MKNICIIDNRIGKDPENDYAVVSLWGDPAVVYPVEAALGSEMFDQVTVLTDNDESRRALEERFGGKIIIREEAEECADADMVCVLSGRAVMITGKMLKDACESLEGGALVGTKKGTDVENISLSENAVDKTEVPFYIYKAGGDMGQKELYPLPPKNALMVRTKADYEMALLLTGKIKGGPSLRVPILKRISEKYEDFLNLQGEKDTVCLVGHSQLDFWETEEIAGLKVRNCGISGITASEYDEAILQKNFLNCDSKFYVVMHGTNDVVINENDEDTAAEIMKTIDYIKMHAVDPKIYFLACTHVTGNADRDNDRLTELNACIRRNLPEDVEWIDLTDLDDETGKLREDYTVDGLHLSEKAYVIVRKKLEDRIYAEIGKHNA